MDINIPVTNGLEDREIIPKIQIEKWLVGLHLAMISI